MVRWSVVRGLVVWYHPSPVTRHPRIEGDIRSYHIVRKAVDGVDFVLHQVALPSVPRSIRDPITINEADIGRTLNLLTAAHDAGVQRFLCLVPSFHSGM